MESKSACRCRCRDDGRPGCMCWCHTVPNDEAHPETCMVLRGGACDCGGAAPPDSLEKWAEDGRKLRLGWIIEYDRLHDEHRKTHDPHTEGKMDQLDLCLQGLDALLARARALGVGRG